MLLFSLALAAGPRPVQGVELLPPARHLKTDRPRLLLRPRRSSHAIAVEQVRARVRQADGAALLARLKGLRHAAAQALLWQVRGDRAAADRAIARMRAYRFPGEVDTFHIYLRLTEFALAYDWLYDYPGLTAEIKRELRAHIRPLAERGMRIAHDHMFHNYVWMSAGGAALWAMATAGDDAASDALYQRIRDRFNGGLFPAWKYLDGLPSEPMGYWALYVYTPGVLTLLAAQSAAEEDLVGALRARDGDWLEKHFDNLIHSTLPDMRYIPWGDLQSGPNGSVAYEMAGIIDATTWALDSAHGAFFSDWLRRKRGLERFHGETGIFALLYTGRWRARAEAPPLSFLAGNRAGGHFIARSGWDDRATVVALTCTDHMGDHHHYDQGGWMLYRQGLLAVDPPVYRRVRGPQQRTDNHNTLLIGGMPQRPVRGQWFVTIDDFKRKLRGPDSLETGDILFYREAGPWAAVACQFGQAYPANLVGSCVRQLLFVRPATVVLVDQISAAPGKRMPPVEWLLHLPARPVVGERRLTSTNGKSWIRCRSRGRLPATPSVSQSDVGTWRATFRYAATGEQLTLIHVIDVGDGQAADGGPAPRFERRQTSAGLELTVGPNTFTFSDREPFGVSAR